VREYTDSNPVRIGFIGYLTQYKGFPLLKSALDELYVDGARDFECHVFVNPSEKPRPYMKCHAGYMADDMQKIYENIDVLVLPSVWQETFGMVVLEALSYGVPVVVSDNVGAKDILLEHEGMGIIVKTSKENLKETISDLIQHREKLRDMNKAICNWKHDFSFENHVRDIIKFYG
jgi:glycosyltransferase involved in cell wall biosynthesis